VLFGSNGEGALLDEDEKVGSRASRATSFPPVTADRRRQRRVNARRVRETQRLAAEGADVVLVHPPAYFGPYLPVAALLSHFRAVADASPVPVLLYHIPKYTKVTLEAGFVAELMRHPNVAGLKDSSGDIKRFADYTSACDRDCRLFVGNGALLYTALELGAAGGILGVANIAPALCADVRAASVLGDAPAAGRLQERLTPLHREIVRPTAASAARPPSTCSAGTAERRGHRCSRSRSVSDSRWPG
jgi:4-hydroxy-2-oxoglutarate aldolase